MLIYLAGPEVFLPNALEIGAAKKELCRVNGFVGAFPLDSGVLPEGLPRDIGHLIFDRCVEMMDRCDLVVANMTPWRGVSMDVGTAVEIGYMHGQGKPVFGYTNVAGDLCARVSIDGFEIEEFGFHDNLMCEGPVWHSGGSVVRRETALNDLFTDLGAFEECLRRVPRPAGA